MVVRFTARMYIRLTAWSRRVTTVAGRGSLRFRDAIRGRANVCLSRWPLADRSRVSVPEAVAQCRVAEPPRRVGLRGACGLAQRYAGSAFGIEDGVDLSGFGTIGMNP